MKMTEKIDPIAENEKAEREWYHRWPNKETWVPTRTLLYSLYSKEKDQSRTAFRRIYFLLGANSVAIGICAILLLIK